MPRFSIRLSGLTFVVQPSGLPSAYVCTAVHVQHLPGYVPCLYQINHCIPRTSRGSEIVPIGERVFRKSFGLIVMHGVLTTPGATALSRICFSAYSFARLRVTAVEAALRDHRIDDGAPAIGLSASAR